MATKSQKIQAKWPDNASMLSIETKPLPRALLRIAPIAEPEASPMRWVWIVAGVAVLFGLGIGGNYWLSQRGVTPVTAKVAAPVNALAKSTPGVAEPLVAPPANALAKPTPPAAEPLPTGNPAPQLSSDLRSLNSRSAPDQAATAPAAEQPPVPSPGQPLQQRGSEPVPVREGTAPATDQSPAPTSSLPPPQAVEHEPRYITVAEGQSLIRIARANHVPAAAIAAANHLEPPYPLSVGSRLLIPDPDSPADQDAQATSDETPSVAPHPAPRRGRLPSEPH